MTTDRNSGAVAVVRTGPFGVHYIACADPNSLPAGTNLYATPPASIPAAEVLALVERMDAMADKPSHSAWKDAIEYWRDELAKLIPRNPE